MPTSSSRRCRRSPQNGLNERVFVRGDKNADYGTIMQVMGRLNSAGYKRIGLVTLEETDS